MAAPLVLGVDAGNSKTVALVAGPDGEVLGAGRGGPGDIYGAQFAKESPDIAQTFQARLIVKF